MLQTYIAILLLLSLMAVWVVKLQKQKSSFRKLLIEVVTFLAGIYFFLEFFLPKELGFDKYHTEISDGITIVGAMAFALGIISLLRVHGSSVLKGKRGWINSLALILGLFFTLGIEIADFAISTSRTSELEKISLHTPFLEKIKADFKEKNLPTEAKLTSLLEQIESLEAQANADQTLVTTNSEDSKKNAALSQAFASSKAAIEKLRLSTTGSYQDIHENYFQEAITASDTLSNTAFDASEQKYQSHIVQTTSNFIFNSLFIPLGAAMFSLLAFYVASAAYRSFRIKTAEAGIMMFAALIVVLGQIPFGHLYISEDLPSIRSWLMEYLSNPAVRAILFGSMIATLGMAIRMWLSLEKSPLESEGET